MRIFRSPKRRAVRQRSGFHVSGQTTGSECKLVHSRTLDLMPGPVEFRFRLEKTRVAPLFTRKRGLVGFGAYLKPNVTTTIEGEIRCKHGQLEFAERFAAKAQADQWSKTGGFVDVPNVESDLDVGNVESILKVTPSDKKRWKLQVFGFSLGGVTEDFYRTTDAWNDFQTKTSIYIPEIFYFPTEHSLNLFPANIDPKEFRTGECVALKSCNRCSRFLLIDLRHERNTLTFSNHCVSRAPCAHSAFSTYRITFNECNRLPDPVRKDKGVRTVLQRGLDGGPRTPTVLQVHYGYQLECKPCKKFFVNAPLNPLRSSTQHREDGLRRRGLEALVGFILGRRSIYASHRIVSGNEFDDYIWRKFGKKCFKCRTSLPSATDMDVDHTLPLGYLWPLDETASCLCPTCNSAKGDKFPVDFYTPEELEQLRFLTGLSQELISNRKVNEEVVRRLKRRLEWFFDEFLADEDFQDIQDGKRTSDLVLWAVQKAVFLSDEPFVLVQEYEKQTSYPPRSVTVQ